MNLRRAQVNDVHKLAQVHVDAWQAAYQGIVPDAFLRQFTYQKREQAFRHALEAKLEETYLLEEDDSAIAILTIGPCRDEDLDAKRTGEIWGIYISPSYWRRRIGSNLLDEAERLLKARGLQDIVLWVLEENTAARAFYEAMGFHLDGASKTIVLGNPLKVVRYAKTLNSDMDKCKYE